MRYTAGDLTESEWIDSYGGQKIKATEFPIEEHPTRGAEVVRMAAQKGLTITFDHPNTGISPLPIKVKVKIEIDSKVGERWYSGWVLYPSECGQNPEMLPVGIEIKIPIEGLDTCDARNVMVIALDGTIASAPAYYAPEG